jgi:hypothetical protein
MLRKLYLTYLLHLNSFSGVGVSGVTVFGKLSLKGKVEEQLN